MSRLFMEDKKLFPDKIHLDTSVSEQIADMQLQFLRQASMNHQMNFDEIKILEILTKVKNVEVEKRLPKEEDPQKAKTKKMIELAKTTPQNLVELPKEEVKNGSEKDTPAERKRTS